MKPIHVHFYFRSRNEHCGVSFVNPNEKGHFAQAKVFIGTSLPVTINFATGRYKPQVGHSKELIALARDELREAPPPQLLRIAGND